MTALRQAGVRTHFNVREIAAVAGSDGALARMQWNCDSGSRKYRLRLPADVHGLDARTAAGAAVRRAHRLRQGRLASTCRRRCRRACSSPAVPMAALRLPLAKPMAQPRDGALRDMPWACLPMLQRALSVLLPTLTPRKSLRDTHSHSHPAPLFPHPDGKEFVDLDEDLTLCGSGQRRAGGLRQR